MYKILIVEDELLLQTYLKENLSKYYKVVDTAVSGEEAVEKTTKHLPDIILMDINLKGKMDGIDAAKKISEDHDIAILFLTSRKDDEALERAKLIKPFGYIIKPVDFSVLKANIDIAVNMFDELCKSPIDKASLTPEGVPTGLQDINKRISESIEKVSMEWKDKNRIEIVNNRFLRQYWILEN